MKRCPCGYHGEERCTCSASQVAKYVGRVSGPLMDRIDIHIEVPKVPYKDLAKIEPGEGSGPVRERVLRAREIQNERFKKYPGLYTNARMDSREIRKFAAPDDACRSLLRAAIEKLGLSARAHDRILRVARTIADLAGCENLEAPHVAEAIQYRSLDRPRWREGG